jgi:hypothetical protein
MFELKSDPPVDDDELEDTIGYLTVDIDYSDDLKFVGFTANKGVDLVIVKGGPAADSYVYDPPEEETSDTDLHAPVNPNSLEYYAISHVSFCYDIELEVSKTANTSYTRDHDWKVSKDNSTKVNETPYVVNLTPGQSYQVDYTVIAETNGYADSDFAVAGEITVTNPHPTATAAGVAVTDELFDGGAPPTKIADGDVTCPDDEIAPGESMTCTYTASLTSKTNGTNKATSTTSTAGIGSGTGSAAFTFGDPTDVVDECVEVTDDKYDGPNAPVLGEVCVNESPKTFNYSKTFSFTTEECGENKVTNTATVDQETGTDPTASSEVTFNVRCADVGGCTLTQGYWKTHSLHGPAPYDDAWLAIGPAGADTTFFLSGKTWYQVFWTPPAGNPYYNLAHQYMAAKLNILNGASSTPAVDAAIAGAEAFFAVKTPSSPLNNATKNQIRAWASTLDQYNNGLIGPGHCSENSRA